MYVQLIVASFCKISNSIRFVLQAHLKHLLLHLNGVWFVNVLILCVFFCLCKNHSANVWYAHLCTYVLDQFNKKKINLNECFVVQVCVCICAKIELITRTKKHTHTHSKTKIQHEKREKITKMELIKQA